MDKTMMAVGGFFGDEPLSLKFEAQTSNKFELSISPKTDSVILERTEVIEFVQMMLDVLRNEL